MLLGLLRSITPQLVSIAHFAVIGYGVSIAVSGSVSFLRYQDSLCEQEEPAPEHGAEPGSDDGGSSVRDGAAGDDATHNTIPLPADITAGHTTDALPHVDRYPTLYTASALSGSCTVQYDAEPTTEQPAKPKQQRAAKRRPVDHS